MLYSLLPEPELDILRDIALFHPEMNRVCSDVSIHVGSAYSRPREMGGETE